MSVVVVVLVVVCALSLSVVLGLGLSAVLRAVTYQSADQVVRARADVSRGSIARTPFAATTATRTTDTAPIAGTDPVPVPVELDGQESLVLRAFGNGVVVARSTRPRLGDASAPASSDGGAR